MQDRWADNSLARPVREYGIRTKRDQNEFIAGVVAQVGRRGAHVLLDSPTLETCLFYHIENIPADSIYVADLDARPHLRRLGQLAHLRGLNIVSDCIDHRLRAMDEALPPGERWIASLYLDTQSTVFGSVKFRPLHTIKSVFESHRLVDGAVLALTITRRGTVNAHVVAHERASALAQRHGYRLELCHGDHHSSNEEEPGWLYRSRPRRGRRQGSNMALLVWRVHLEDPHA